MTKDNIKNVNFNRTQKRRASNGNIPKGATTLRTLIAEKKAAKEAEQQSFLNWNAKKREQATVAILVVATVIFSLIIWT
jgi:hypothetical protein